MFVYSDGPTAATEPVLCQSHFMLSDFCGMPMCADILITLTISVFFLHFYCHCYFYYFINTIIIIMIIVICYSYYFHHYYYCVPHHYYFRNHDHFAIVYPYFQTKY